ncbi:hypothetical protein [Erythrobacter sp. YT30]|uniref:hypothetical protein n=1 Tax=Erythrobacter sp. YT30 TaxID=1735012 RepID=UPI00076C0D57|nr:hypothetical protein [Erythrobacter sp. YT30]KWV93293.1 hypothetical protein AUC45_04060 [Erythrobacter sp. YT30]
MTKFKKTLAKGTLGTVAAGAMALGSATPAMADDRRGGIDAGDVIAGAVIVGGIAALAGAFDGDRDRRGHWRDGRWDRGDRHWRGGRHFRGNRFNGRRAVERCVRVAERQARRFGGYRFADVTEIRDVDRRRDGFRVKGRMQVEGFRGRGYGYGNRGFDRGRFTCWFDGRGRPYVEFRGIRGLR